MELLQSYPFGRRYFHAAPPCKQGVLSQRIQIYTCLDECRAMKFCLIYRLARVGARSIGRLINITGNSFITESLVCYQRVKSLQCFSSL